MKGRAAELATAPAAVIGRSHELARVRNLVDTSGVLIEGAAGIGKTTVWRAALQDATDRGHTVLSATPSEAEQTFSYAVLSDLIEPVPASLIEGLPEPQRRVLDQVSHVAGSDDRVDPHVVAVAARNLLLALGQHSRVVVAIDDVQWADAASLRAIEFALRRTPGVALLAAARSEAALPLRFVPTRVPIGGLSVGALHHLVVQRLGRALSRPALLRVHAASDGNPFYALELARAGADRGSLPSSLHRLLTHRVDALPAPTGRALARLALAGGSWPDEAVLDPAADEGIIERSAGRVRFTHPLYAEAAVETLSHADRRTLHGEIAAATDDPEQRARHLALAATAPDETIAAALAEVAERSARRGALSAAGDLWQLAAHLTPESAAGVRAERSVHAGIDHLLAGDPDPAIERLDANLPLLPPGPLRQRGLIHLALRLARDDSRAVIPVLEQALAETDDRRVRHETIHLVAAFHDLIGDVARAAQIVREHVERVEAGGTGLDADAVLLLASRELACDRPAWELIERARRLVAQRDADADRSGWGSAPLSVAHLREERFDKARAALEAAADEAVRVGSAYMDAGMLLSLSAIELSLGDAERALTLADDALCIGEQIGAPYLICAGHTALAEVTGVLGRDDDARAHAAIAIDLAERVHAVAAADAGRLALGIIELACGEAERAAHIYDGVTDDGLSRLAWLAGGRPSIDVVEAFVETGRVSRAAQVVAGIAADARERRIGEALLAAGAGDVDAAVAMLEAVPAARAPFRHARELLLVGRLQRRARRRSAARAALVGAGALFDGIGAVRWRARVDDELGRLGGRAPSGRALTEAERRVAELVAVGLSNKDIAARLVVTVRTVETHLSKIYAKLDVPSRAALAARWRDT